MLRLLLLMGTLLLAMAGRAQEADVIRIRCGASATADGFSPLLVVDGQAYPQSSTNDLDPDHIVSISVIRDVTAAALYGAAARGGVVIVTTDGKSLPPADYTLRPLQIPTDLFVRYQELDFTGDRTVRYYRDGRKTTLAKLQQLDATRIRDVRVYNDARKLALMRETDVQRVVHVRTRRD